MFHHFLLLGLGRAWCQCQCHITVFLICGINIHWGFHRFPLLGLGRAWCLCRCHITVFLIHGIDICWGFHFPLLGLRWARCRCHWHCQFFNHLLFARWQYLRWWFWSWSLCRTCWRGRWGSGIHVFKIAYLLTLHLLFCTIVTCQPNSCLIVTLSFSLQTSLARTFPGLATIFDETLSFWLHGWQLDLWVGFIVIDLPVFPLVFLRQGWILFNTWVFININVYCFILPLVLCRCWCQYVFKTSFSIIVVSWC